MVLYLLELMVQRWIDNNKQISKIYVNLQLRLVLQLLLKRCASLKVHAPSQDSLLSMSGQCRSIKLSPLAPIQDNSEGPSQLQSALWSWLSCCYDYTTAQILHLLNPVSFPTFPKVLTTRALLINFLCANSTSKSTSQEPKLKQQVCME